jgi:hypothetical protein
LNIRRTGCPECRRKVGQHTDNNSGGFLENKDILNVSGENSTNG